MAQASPEFPLALVLLIIPAFALYFGFLWTLVVFLISRFGWRRFAMAYPAGARPQGEVFSSRFAQFGRLAGRYRNVVQVIPTDEGLYFSVMRLFRPFHPPFLLPWKSIEHVEACRLPFFQGIQIVVRDEAGTIRMLLPERFAAEVIRKKEAGR